MTELSDGLGRVGRQAFIAAAAAFIGESVGDDVFDAVRPLLRHLPAADRDRLSIALYALEHASRLRGRPPLSALGREEAAEVVRRWATSSVAPLRQAAAAIRALALLAYYGRDEAGGRIGYDGPWLGRVDVPVLPAPDLRAPPPSAEALAPGVTHAHVLRHPLELRTQVCVIGTGAGGAAVLDRLAARGVDVLGVEAGGLTTAAECSQRELDMLPLLFQEAGLRATADKAISILQGSGVGGSTLHNTGLVYAPPQAILERWRKDHGFPLDDAATAHYVAYALDALHAVPIPADRINENNDALRRGADALGWAWRVSLHNRSECCGCGYCMIGCAYNRKYNAALTLLPRAIAQGARIIAGARVTAIGGTQGARRVTCELLDGSGARSGRQAVIHAQAVVLAAGALDTPALLRASGLGGARVGRGLRLHPAAVVSATFPEPVTAWRGLPQAVVVHEFAGFERGDGRGGFLLLPSAANTPGLAAVTAPGIGEEHRTLMRRYPDRAAAAVLLHDETEGDVRLARDGRPSARYWPDARDSAELLRGIRALARLYLAAGAESVHLPFITAPPVHSERELDAALARARIAPHCVLLSSVHPQASCAIGADRGDSAADPHGQLWGAPGIHVADASAFPTSVGVPPQITTIALAAATADHIAENLP